MTVAVVAVTVETLQNIPEAELNGSREDSSDRSDSGINVSNISESDISVRAVVIKSSDSGSRNC